MSLPFVVFATRTDVASAWVDSRWAAETTAQERARLLSSLRPELSVWITNGTPLEEDDTEEESTLEECPACSDTVEEGTLESVTFSIQGEHRLTVSAYVCSSCQDCQEICANCGDAMTLDNYRHASRLESHLRDMDSLGRYHYLGASSSCSDCGDICQSCADDHRYCEDCDVTYCDDYSHDECGDNYSSGSDLDLHGYGYRPAPIFHGTGTRNAAKRPTFGMELEVSGVSQETVDAWTALGNYAEHAWYGKEDSTVNGAEFVSHPRTYASWAEHMESLAPVLRMAQEEGAECTQGNGIHIHVGRDAFTGRAHLARFITLVDLNPEPMCKIARRVSEQWAPFGAIRAARYRGNALRHLTNPDGACALRGAVNTANSDTIEIRIFRGSLDVTTVLGTVALVAACVEYTRTLTVQECMAGALTIDSLTDWAQYRAEYAPILDALEGACDAFTPGNVKHHALVG